ncbi:MAG: TetR/AcrR family transcriptional regulator [Prolixibacteraceae bacterium]|nr:TetR/AcrR family transcriptional regulator [Prolixibacteraceae bacterium]
MNNRTERQKEIIYATLTLIDEKGIQGMTIRNLSVQLGISESAIYRHFEDKTHILLALLDMVKNNSNEIFESELNSNQPAIKKIEHLFERHFKSFSNMPSLSSIIFSEEMFRNEKRLTEKVSGIILSNIKIMQAILKEAQLDKEIRSDISPDYLSIILLGTLRLFIKNWHISGFSYDLREEGNKLNKEIKLLIT